MAGLNPDRKKKAVAALHRLRRLEGAMGWEAELINTETLLV